MLSLVTYNVIAMSPLCKDEPYAISYAESVLSDTKLSITSIESPVDMDAYFGIIDHLYYIVTMSQCIAHMGPDQLERTQKVGASS